jgi:hypothetical protein
MNTTGDLRRELSKCFELARDGKLAGDALRGVIGCANQINKNLDCELRFRVHLHKVGVAPGGFGSMPLSTES